MIVDRVHVLVYYSCTESSAEDSRSQRKTLPSFREFDSVKLISRRSTTAVRLRERARAFCVEAPLDYLFLNTCGVWLLPESTPFSGLCSSLEDRRFPAAAATASLLPLAILSHTPTDYESLFRSKPSRFDSVSHPKVRGWSRGPDFSNFLPKTFACWVCFDEIGGP